MKTILITGASSGLGQALAEHYAAVGVTLHISGRNDERLQAVAERCRARGAAVYVSCCDVTDKEAMHAWISAADAAMPLDLVIANAGISAGTGGADGESAAQSERIFRTNVDGVLHTLHPIIPAMQRRRRGQLAVMSSLAALRALPSAPAYSASKAAVKTYGEALRGHLQRWNVGVSVICPGYVRTPMTAVNTFPMPGLMTAQKAAHIIARGLERNRARIVFPLWLYWLLCGVAALPGALTDPVFARLPGKSAQQG